MKNCYFFGKNFSPQVALNEFVDLAKFYVGYEIHKHGSVLLHDREYADKLYIIFDGTVDKVFQKLYGEVEGQTQDKRRRVSCLGFENPGSFLHLQTPRKGSEEQQITLKVPLEIERKQRPEAGKAFLPSLNDKSESCISEGNDYDTSNTTNSNTSIKRSSSLKPSSMSQTKEVQRHHSQQCVFQNFENSKPAIAEYPNIFEDLIRFIAKKHPEIRRKFDTEDILRADKVKTFTTGEYFGETFCISNQPRSNFMYAVSSPETHLLTLRREDYHKIMKQLECKNHEKFEVFWTLFPSSDKGLVQRFSQHFSQKHFEVDEVIYSQGSFAQDLYILQSGGVQLLGNQDSSNHKGALLPIASVIKDQVFGEESLLIMDSRQETAVASASNTTVFALSTSLLHELRDGFASLFDDLQDSAQEKFRWRQRKAKESSEVEETNPTDSSSKNSLVSLSKLPLLPLRDVRERQNLDKPRHTIQVPCHRSFLNEKSPTHSTSSAFSR